MANGLDRAYLIDGCCVQRVFPGRASRLFGTFWTLGARTFISFRRHFRNSSKVLYLQGRDTRMVFALSDWSRFLASQLSLFLSAKSTHNQCNLSIDHSRQARILFLCRHSIIIKDVFRFHKITLCTA